MFFVKSLLSSLHEIQYPIIVDFLSLSITLARLVKQISMHQILTIHCQYINVAFSVSISDIELIQ